MAAINYGESFYLKHPDKLAELDSLLTQFPASSLVQFLKLYQLKENQDKQYSSVAKKTALYFNNPNWLLFQLTQESAEKEIYQSGENAEDTGHFAITLPENKSEENAENEEIVAEENVTEIDQMAGQEEPNMLIEPEENLSAGNIFENGEVQAVDSEILTQEHFAEESLNDSTAGEEKTGIPDFASGTGEEIIENKNKPAGEEFKSSGEFLEEEPVVSLPAEEERSMIPVPETLPEPLPDALQQEAQTSIEKNYNNLAFESPENGGDVDVPFEPLHTVDYFASQGIRIREEMLTNDKLGKQVKSFTDWLKSMKKLHPGKLPEQNEVIEKIIQSSAEQSNADAEVLTEAMAEVLIKQNKQEKAVEMYQKLSLMNPSKSAYFAAKIERIKTS